MSYGRCTLGVGCDEYGVCYAAAHGQPDQCGAPLITLEPLPSETGLRDHQKDLIEQIARTFCVPADLLKKDD